jgi:hypothetical protein
VLIWSEIHTLAVARALVSDSAVVGVVAVAIAATATILSDIIAVLAAAAAVIVFNYTATARNGYI